MNQEIIDFFKEDHWKLGNLKFKSRLLHCFGSNPSEKLSPKQATEIIQSSGTEFITLYTHGEVDKHKSDETYPLGYGGLTFGEVKGNLELDKYTFLINTNHALSVEEAIHRSLVTREITNCNIVKLEVLTPDLKRPINKLVIEASEKLRKMSFDVIPLINNNVEDAKVLQDLGCLGLRVMMSDIGSLGGMTSKDHFKKIRKEIKISLIAEGGMKTPIDAYNSLAAGMDATLTNKPLFTVDDPVYLIKVMKQFVDAGRINYLTKKMKSRSSQGGIFFAQAIEGLSVEKIQENFSPFHSIFNRNNLKIINQDLMTPNPKEEAIKLIEEELKLLSTADMLVVDMSIANRNYLGCTIEMTKAKELGIPIIVYTGNSNYQTRGSLSYLTSYVVRNYDELEKLIISQFSSLKEEVCLSSK